MSDTPEYDHLLTKQIIRALGYEELDFNDLLYRLKGAQQQRVLPVLQELLSSNTVLPKGLRYALAEPPREPDWDGTRARVIELLNALPPGNPLAAQWWFNFDSAVSLAERVWKEAWDSQVAFLGTPTIGFAYAVASGRACTILEYDKHVVSAVQAALNRVNRGDLLDRVVLHDAFDVVPPELRSQFAAIVCDPPWYEDYFDAFFATCLELGDNSAKVYWSLAPLLTRPHAESERARLLSKIIAAGCSVHFIDSACFAYVIPDFEAEAYRHVPGFHSKVWRRGDLLVLKLPQNPAEVRSTWTVPSKPERLSAVPYYDPNRDFRLFHLPQRENPSLPAAYEEDREFARTVSLSEASDEHVALWSSRRKGFAVSRLPFLSRALELWQGGRKLPEIRDTLTRESRNPVGDRVPETISLLELATASEEETPKIIRRHLELRELEVKNLNLDWATANHRRETPAAPDPYRLEFQRDRDKILWSKSFKRLASKTQVIPNFGDDRFRSRLTHTLEVSQVAQTLARAFGLNEDLTEAIALAHDIGHTPFGHAGEEAINDFLCEVFNGCCDTCHQRTNWFSHYEHGVDVLRWLEDIYFSPGAGRARGLGISIEVYEGVFKHMYHRWQRSGSRTNKKSQEELYKYSKHADVIPEGPVLLEGQAVRIADKICYLVEDLEDGILAGVIRLADLAKCRLFSRPYIDLVQAAKESPLHRYLSQRGQIINLLTKDTLENTQVLLRKLGSRDRLREHEDYVFRPSDEIAVDISEVWSKVQVGVLHRHPSVAGANARAARIVKSLLMLFTFCTDLVDLNLRLYFELLDSYVDKYREALGRDEVEIDKAVGGHFDAALARDSNIRFSSSGYRVPLTNVIMAKDYVASLTDGQAIHLYRTYELAGNSSVSL